MKIKIRKCLNCNALIKINKFFSECSGCGTRYFWKKKIIKNLGQRDMVNWKHIKLSTENN